MKQREPSIDILRAIAFMGLVMAHVRPSGIMMQLRSFDVPMMVFLSGVSYYMSNAKSCSYFQYVGRRFVRIIIPTWIFLILYFYLYKHDSCIGTIARFPLITGWYVWIMRVFFIIALFAPFVSKVLNKTNLYVNIALLTTTLVVNEFLCRHYAPAGTPSDSWPTVTLMNIGYIAVFAIGYIISRLKTRNVALFGIASFGIYIALAAYLYETSGEYISTNTQKYPPPTVLFGLRNGMHHGVVACPWCLVQNST